MSEYSDQHFPDKTGAGDKIFWSTFGGEIRVGNLDGSGTPQTIYHDGPVSSELTAGGEAVVLDLSTGRIYWGDWSRSQIRVGSIDGSTPAQTLFQEPGATPPHGSGPVGIAIDPAAGKIYWTNWGLNYPSPSGEWGQVRVGNLDGSGTPKTLYEGEWAAGGLGLDPVTGRLYWTRGGLLNSDNTLSPDAIRVGSIDGSSAAQNLGPNYGNEEGPNAIAIDPVAGKGYWANYGYPDPTGSIRVGNLDGTGTPETMFENAGQPFNIAFDKSAGKIYWGDGATNVIRVGNLDGTGTPQDLFVDQESLHWVALLRAPQPRDAPLLTGASQVGSTLTSSQGGWAPDQIGAFLFCAPSNFSYRWTRDGEQVVGATGESYIPTRPGRYQCEVTASNPAGSAVATTSSQNVKAASE